MCWEFTQNLIINGICVNWENRSGLWIWGEGGYWVHARMVRFNHGIGRYEHADPIKSEWETYAIYVSIDAAQIDKALGSLNYGASVSD